MSEEQIQGEETTVEAVPVVPPSVGQSLREAREAAGMSVFEVAQALRLGRKQIEALEDNAWSELPGMTSVRGFVRNYARLLNLDSAALMAMLDGAVPKAAAAVSLELPPATSGTLPEAGEPQRKDVFGVVSGLVMVVLAVAAFFFVPDGFIEKLVFGNKTVVTAEEPKQDPAAGTPGNAVLLPPATSAEPVLPPASQPPVGAVEPQVPAVLNLPPATGPSTNVVPVAAVTPSVASPAPVVVQGPIRLNFSGAAWVEVKGKDGKILFSQSNAAGSEKEVAGDGPYSFVIGNAAQVKLSFKGKPVDLEPHTKGAVARLTLE